VRRLFLLALLAGTFLAGCGGGSTVGPLSEGGDLARGRELFNSAGCGGCHTMEAAGSLGTQGPSLDVGFGPSREQGFAESTFQQVVREQIAFPGVDSAMPPNLVEGQDAEDVAFFIAQCAGNREDAQCAPSGGGEITATEGSEVFAQAGCGNCHILAAAGSSGTIGPNLDDSQPSHDLVTDRVTNGFGAMPSFRDQLSDEQIEAVSDFVAENAGG
jgi:mono/diheme cytochrome c family protein